MAALHSSEVALDFQDALTDLQINNRYEISNLTIVAKENTEHAQAISQALEAHIKTTAPPRKLPALYVLDSIVKNVGTPYTIYLGRNLYSTFMDAYTLVDGATRKSMEGMLKTWKEPVPGTMDPRPVFPPEVTRVIENALIRARTAAVQQSQQTKLRQPFHLPPRPTSAQYRDTPTPPPQHNAMYGHAPPPQFQHNGYPGQQATPQGYPPQQPTPDLTRSLLSSLGQPDPAGDAHRLQADIDRLINQTQSEFARNPFDQKIQQRLKALLDLQNIVKTQQLSVDAIGMIKAQVSQLSAAAGPNVQPTPSAQPPAQSAWQPPPVNNLQGPTPAGHQTYNRPVSVQPPPSQSAFAPGALEALLASTASGNRPSTPTLQSALPSLQNLPAFGQSPRSAAQASAQVQGGNFLIDALRAAGLVGGSAPSVPPTPSAQPAVPSISSAQDLLKSLQGLPQLGNPAAATISAGPPKPKIPLSQASLRIPRPELITALYTSLPNQCSTCGRRFSATEAGRARKAAHIDWHFRTNQRIADASNRAQHRSWFVDEMEWIQLHEIDVSTTTGEDYDGANGNTLASGLHGLGGSGPRGAGSKKGPKEQYIPAPTGVEAATNATCPICQEKFEAVWHDEAQEWVWMDAVRVGPRIYHASCRNEVQKATGGMSSISASSAGARGGTRDRNRSATPESSLLGKRKAESPLSGIMAKLAKD